MQNDLNIEKFNPTVKELTALAESYSRLEIKGVDDTAGYKAMDAARKKLKETRVRIEKDGKLLRADALEFQRKVIAKEKELIGLIEPIEIELSMKQKRINDEKEMIRRKKLMPERVARLLSIGVTISEETLLFMEDEKFAAYFNSKNAEFLAEKERKLKAEKEEAERKQREEQEKIDAEKRKIEEEKARIEAEKNKPFSIVVTPPISNIIQVDEESDRCICPECGFESHFDDTICDDCMKKMDDDGAFGVDTPTQPASLSGSDGISNDVIVDQKTGEVIARAKGFNMIPVLFAFDYERQLGSLDANSDLMKVILLRLMKGEKYNFSIGFNKDEVLCFSIQPDRTATLRSQKDPDSKFKCIVNFCDNLREIESPLCYSHLNRPTR